MIQRKVVYTFYFNSQVERPSLDLFKVIFAESSDESTAESDNSDEDTKSTLQHKADTNPDDTSRLESPNNQSSHSRWQDLSTVTTNLLNQTSQNLHLTTALSTTSTSTISQDSEDRQECSDFNKEKCQHQSQVPTESYGPALPPSEFEIWFYSL